MYPQQKLILVYSTYQLLKQSHRLLVFAGIAINLCDALEQLKKYMQENVDLFPDSMKDYIKREFERYNNE